MNLIARTNTSLSAFPPLVIYTIGLADATLWIYVGYLLSKISQ